MKSCCNCPRHHILVSQTPHQPKLVFIWVQYLHQIEIWKCWFVRREGKPGKYMYPWENQLNPHMALGQNQTQLHWYEASTLSTMLNLDLLPQANSSCKIILYEVNSWNCFALLSHFYRHFLLVDDAGLQVYSYEVCISVLP